MPSEPAQNIILLLSTKLLPSEEILKPDCVSVILNGAPFKVLIPAYLYPFSAEYLVVKVPVK